MKNVIDTVASQYANSPTLRQLIDSMNEYFDPSTNFEAFYNFVWNVDTAKGFGLDIWGRIVNVSRDLLIPNTPELFGFDGAQAVDAPAVPVSFLAPARINNLAYLAPAFVEVTPSRGTDVVGFDQAPFYNTEAVTQTYRLEDDAYRTLILVKALSNISVSTSASINRLLQSMFAGRGKCYVRDDGGMHITYVFEFILRPIELAILEQSSAIPRPAGVASAILQLDLSKMLGFSEAKAQPFGSGVFFNQ